jgi:hypothetical protein
MTMMTNTASRIDAHDPAAHGANGPTLLTEEEIALVGGGVTDAELPYLEGVGGLAMMGAGGYVVGAVAVGAMVATAPAWVAAAVVVGGITLAGVGGVLVWDAVRRLC